MRRLPPPDPAPTSPPPRNYFTSPHAPHIAIPYHHRLAIAHFAAHTGMTPAEFIINACELIHSLSLTMPTSILSARRALSARKNNNG